MSLPKVSFLTVDVVVVAVVVVVDVVQRSEDS